MERYEYANRVIDKVKNSLRFDSKIRGLMRGSPNVVLDRTLCLSEVVWHNDDKCLYVKSNGVVYTENGKSVPLLHYRDYDELLRM